MEFRVVTVDVIESELDAAVAVAEMELVGAAVTVPESELDSAVAACEAIFYDSDEVHVVEDSFAGDTEVPDTQVAVDIVAGDVASSNPYKYWKKTV
uniref:Uncharacterized protein n=1 Tax=Oryza rufipogon TaxID=4529 RepID=A0A0E0PY98_ORYRU